MLRLKDPWFCALGQDGGAVAELGAALGHGHPLLQLLAIDDRTTHSGAGRKSLANIA